MCLFKIAYLDGEESALEVALEVDDVPDALSPPRVDGGVLVEAVAVSDRLRVRAELVAVAVGSAACGAVAVRLAVGPLRTII